MAPTPQQYQVALDAMRNDAQKWADCGTDLGGASSTAAGLTLDALHFSYVADKLGITALYQQFQAKMTGLLEEGRQTSENVATALRTAAQTYQDQEDAGVHRMNNVW